MKIAFNAWFLDDTLAQNTGTGQYARNLLQEIGEIAPDVQIEQVHPRGRGDLAKVHLKCILQSNRKKTHFEITEFDIVKSIHTPFFTC